MSQGLLKTAAILKNEKTLETSLETRLLLWEIPLQVLLCSNLVTRVRLFWMSVFVETMMEKLYLKFIIYVFVSAFIAGKCKYFCLSKQICMSVNFSIIEPRVYIKLDL